MANERVIPALALLLALLSRCAAQQAAQPMRFQLDNGLTILLSENHVQQRVAIESFYRAGFMQEPKGKAHLAHVVEHMVCHCPTASYGPHEAFQLIQSRGVANAETMPTFVHYDYVVPSSDLELALRIESERLTSIRFSEEILREELPKIVQEMDFVQTNPNAGLLKFGMIGLSHVLRFGEVFVPVYHGPFHLTVSDVAEFHRAHYRPDGAVLVIVGDFSAAAAKDLIIRYFAAIPKGPALTQAEPMQPRDLEAAWDLASDAVYVVYPNAGAEPATCMTLTLFGNSLSARLWADTPLRKATKTCFCTVSIYPVGEMPFFAFAEGKPGVSVEALREKLRTSVDSGIRGFSIAAFAQAKTAMLFFYQSSLLSDPAVANTRFEHVLAQEAINIGMRDLARGDVPLTAILQNLNALDYGTAHRVVASRLSPQNASEIVFRRRNP